MTSALRNTINGLAASFASGVLNAIRSASLEEILAETAGGRRSAIAVGRPAAKGAGGSAGVKGGRLGRRSSGDIDALVGRIVALLVAKPEGLRAEEIRLALGIESKELPRPMMEALAQKKIIKQGQKRATTYFVKGGAKSPARAPKRKSPAGVKKAGRGRKASAKASESSAA